VNRRCRKNDAAMKPEQGAHEVNSRPASIWGRALVDKTDRCAEEQMQVNLKKEGPRYTLRDNSTWKLFAPVQCRAGSTETDQPSKKRFEDDFAGLGQP